MDRVCRRLTGALAALAFCCVALAGSAAEPAETVARTAQEAQANSRLDGVRAEIRKISEAQKEISLRKNDVAAGLREQEIRIAGSARELRELDAQLVAQQDRLGELQGRRDALNVRLGSQRATLAALLRSAYAIGHHEELKLLLAEENVATIDRMLAYFRYFERARVAEIERVLNDLGALAEVHRQIEAQTAELVAARARRVADAAQLDGERAQRLKLLADLDGQLKDEQARLAALGKDEKGLVDLLEKLRDIFADIPKQIVGAEPFAQMRGRLAWPLRGKVALGFGARESNERTSSGLVIDAAEGSEVRAISHGRVVFADWMRGFGLLLIVDHGDGYMSLYGYNETLLKDVGDWVNSNEVVASSGSTGGRKASGLYFELRAQGKAVDPRGWLKP
ncbi:MAG: peptidoglycan DD-metalloendopeptidase family protein [Rudaea sp.]